jgi:hypothetical protein
MGIRVKWHCHFCKTAGLDPLEHTSVKDNDRLREASARCPYKFAFALTACLGKILPAIRQPKVDAVYGVNYESDGYAVLVSSLLAFGRHCKDDIRSVKQRALRQVIGMAGFFLGNPRFIKEEEATLVNQYLRSLKCWVPPRLRR